MTALPTNNGTHLNTGLTENVHLKSLKQNCVRRIAGVKRIVKNGGAEGGSRCERVS